jgi:hypothetical protein
VSPRGQGSFARENWRLQASLGAPLRRGALTCVPVGIAALLQLETDDAIWGGISTAALLGGFVAFDAPARVRTAWQLIFAPVLGATAALGVLSTDPGSPG